MKFILFFALTAAQSNGVGVQTFMDLKACEDAKEKLLTEFKSISRFGSKEPFNTTKAFCVPDRTEK